MYPYLFESWLPSNVVIPSYAVLLAVAFLTAYADALRRTFARGDNPKHTERLFLIIVVGALTGGRLFHVVFEEWPYYQQNPSQALAVWEGGFTFYGGLLFCFVLIFLYARLQKLAFLRTMDLLAAPAVLGLAIGRVGCFLAGCCWGTPTSLPWGVLYSHPHTLSQIRGVALHPVQIYESLGCLAIYFSLNRLNKKRFRPGTLFARSVILYSLLRFALEMLRGDAYRGFLTGGHLSLAQFFSILLLIPTSIFLFSRPQIES